MRHEAHDGTAHSTLPPMRGFLEELIEDRLGMSREPSNGSHVSNVVTGLTTRKET
jgi:hypothetical protein